MAASQCRRRRAVVWPPPPPPLWHIAQHTQHRVRPSRHYGDSHGRRYFWGTTVRSCAVCVRECVVPDGRRDVTRDGRPGDDYTDFFHYIEKIATVTGKDTYTLAHVHTHTYIHTRVHTSRTQREKNTRRNGDWQSLTTDEKRMPEHERPVRSVGSVRRAARSSVSVDLFTRRIKKSTDRP